jgi:hypothetical protein
MNIINHKTKLSKKNVPPIKSKPKSKQIISPINILKITLINKTPLVPKLELKPKSMKLFKPLKN